jgi:hypothetical protein
VSTCSSALRSVPSSQRSRRHSCPRAGRALLGYVDAQWRGLVGDRHATRTRELSREHGYNTKYAMPALRIAHQGLELLSTGRITLPIADPERSRWLQVRRGEVPLRDVLNRLHEQSVRLEDTMLASDLPDEPDRKAVDRLLVNAYERACWRARVPALTVLQDCRFRSIEPEVAGPHRRRYMMCRQT